jgi:hypothetical protein
MSDGSFLTLGSIEAVRPVFLIVMGVFLALIGWRLAKTSGVWTARWLVAGGMLLGFGYAVMLPLYEARILEPFSPGRHFHGSPAVALAWHVVKITVMNVGWLLFGIGIALHANLLGSPAPRPRAQTRPAPSPHESIA